ncbi:MAG: short subunit dehydrogenase-like uncharacterized protein [Paraglaciecola psychrophila]|jgi:short subunit dehydrogenase-like uncharacterized protein
MSTEFDILIYGATGFTGKLVAEYVLQTYGTSIKWGMAGRSKSKLEEVRDAIGAPADTALVICDSNNDDEVNAMVARTKVLITTVGPYQLYGDKVIVACANAGTDYVDLCGEPHWIAKNVMDLNESAKKSGARIVFSCGFDSIPTDLGVFYLQEQAKARLGHVLPRVRGRVRDMQGSASGGTVASGVATTAAAQQDPSIIGLLVSPFAQTPGFEGPTQPNGNKPYFDDAVASWVGPFMMAMINTKAVHRSNYLMQHQWGEDLQYDEMIMLPGDPAQGGAAAVDPFAMDPNLKPGDGPSREEREAGYYDILFVGSNDAGEKLQACVKGDMDPGYGSTSKMLAESAICLALDISQERTGGGCWTTASSMGSELLARLEANAGLTFTIEE